MCSPANSQSAWRKPPTAEERNTVAQRLLTNRLSADHVPAPEVAYALARLRVEHAAERVRAGDSLSDVAFGAGYADQSHFNRDLQELVGCTPSEFPFGQIGLRLRASWS